MQMNITPELQVERKQDSNQVEFAAIPALKGARIKCKAGVRSVRGGKRDLYPVLLQDGVFYHIGKFSKRTSYMIKNAPRG